MEEPHGVTLEELRSECEKYLASPADYDIDDDRMLDLIEFALDQGEYSSAWLLIGAALTRFPDNHFVWLHLAFLLYEEGRMDYAMTVLKRFRKFDYWAQSLMILIESSQHPERVPDSIRNLVAHTDTFQEDNLANLLNVGRETGNYSLLCELLPEIERKTESVGMLWREMAAWAEARQDSANQQLWIEKYIDACPYDAEAWEMSARYYLYSEANPQEAMSSAEYALAINPRSVIGNLARIEAASMISPPGEANAGQIERMIDWFKQALNDLADATLCLEQYVNFLRLYDLCERTDIQQHLYDLNKLYPENIHVLDLLLRLSETNGEWEIQEFMISAQLTASHPDTSQELIYVSWARKLRADSNFHASYTILKGFYEYMKIDFEDSLVNDAYLEMLYLQRRFENIMDIDVPAPDEDSFVMVLFHKVLAMARLGKFENMPKTVAILMTDVMGHSSARSMADLLSGLSIGNFCVRLLEWADDSERDLDQLNQIDPYSHILKILYGE